MRRSRADYFDRRDRLADRIGHGVAAAASRWLNVENVHGIEREVRSCSELDRAMDGTAKRRYLTVAVLFVAPVVLTGPAAAT
jgi:hypothetical protein